MIYLGYAKNRKQSSFCINSREQLTHNQYVKNTQYFVVILRTFFEFVKNWKFDTISFHLEAIVYLFIFNPFCSDWTIDLLYICRANIAGNVAYQPNGRWMLCTGI